MGGRAGKWSLICPLFVSTPLLTKSAAGRRGRSCCEASQQCTLCGIYGHMRAETPLPQALRDRSRTATRRLRSRSSCRTHSASRRRRPPEPHAGSTLLSSRCRSASGLAAGSSTGRTELSQQRLPNSSSQKERLWLRAGNPFGAMTRHATWSSEPSGRKSDARARLPRSQPRLPSAFWQRSLPRVRLRAVCCSGQSSPPTCRTCGRRRHASSSSPRRSAMPGLPTLAVTSRTFRSESILTSLLFYALTTCRGIVRSFSLCE